MVSVSSKGFLLDVWREEGEKKEEKGRWRRKERGREGVFVANKQKSFP